MKHRSLDELGKNASLRPIGDGAMSRLERLERWAKLLSAEPQRVLNTLEGTEYQSGESQARMRFDHSAISVAFDDPVLRSQGLADDTYGSAKQFFEMSDEELHDVVCHCHFGPTVHSGTVASRLHALTSASRAAAGFGRAWRLLGQPPAR